MLSANDPALIEWGSSVGIGWNSVNDINYPALATAGTEVVVTFEEGMSALKYALGKILLQYENGTLVKGSSDKVYVVLNQYRYWIPDPATFDAMGYDWGDPILEQERQPSDRLPPFGRTRRRSLF